MSLDNDKQANLQDEKSITQNLLNVLNEMEQKFDNKSNNQIHQDDCWNNTRYGRMATLL